MTFLIEYMSETVAINHTKAMALREEKGTVVDKERRAAAIRKYVVFDPDKPSWCWHKPPWTPFRFLDLPADVRRRVYIELAWCDPKSIREDRPQALKLKTYSIDVFARVNHQVHDEIQSIIHMQNFRLMDLPYDVRERIYVQLSAEDPELVAVRLRRKAKNVKYAAQHVPRSTDHLIRVNRQIRDEVLSMYYRRRLFTVQMSGTKIRGECSCGCKPHQCTLLAVYRYWRPNTPLVRQCELTLDLPLELDAFRIVSNLLTSDNAKVHQTITSEYHDLTVRQRGLNCFVQQIKIRIVSGGTQHRFKPARLDNHWDWRDFQREPWGSAGGNEGEEANGFDTEQALVSELVQLLRRDSAKKAKMTMEFWYHDHRRRFPKTLTLANEEQSDRMLDGDIDHFWATLEPELALTSVDKGHSSFWGDD
ncbi:hypothetical protein MMC15_006683 [Xylographa vitiligo]|nr:hypothetical protein [Xylographa vitiligo]